MVEEETSREYWGKTYWHIDKGYWIRTYLVRTKEAIVEAEKK